MNVHKSEKSERDALKEIIYNRAPDNASRDMAVKQLLHADLRALVDCLHDGLAYGNWPWVSYKVEDLIK